MANYKATNWQDTPNTSTPITAAELNRIDGEVEKISNSYVDRSNYYKSLSYFALDLHPEFEFERITPMPVGYSEEIAVFIPNEYKRYVSNSSFYTFEADRYTTRKDGLVIWVNGEPVPVNKQPMGVVDLTAYVTKTTDNTYLIMLINMYVGYVQDIDVQLWHKSENGSATMPAIATVMARGTAEGIAEIIEEANE